MINAVIFRAMWESGASRKAIALEFGISTRAVTDASKRFGLVSRTHGGQPVHSEDLVKLIIAYRREGCSSQTIGDVMGLSKGAVGGVVRRWMARTGARFGKVPQRQRSPDPVPPVVPIVREIIVAPPPMPPRRLTPIAPPQQCQYPVGGQGGPKTIRFECTATPVSGRPYCEAHARICYQGFVGHRPERVSA